MCQRATQKGAMTGGEEQQKTHKLLVLLLLSLSLSLFLYTEKHP